MLSFLIMSGPPQSTVQPLSAIPSVWMVGDLFITACLGMAPLNLAKLSQDTDRSTGMKTTLERLAGLWTHFLDCR